ncbi:Dolichyl-diphosphooligosaccharide--protein glycosyltransferase subunit stt3 [Hondaea fermentalgiana]|uniref:dolichyl-diphosphooligosaccharide--protein glycotransferase n=1 Tax=Hondaea fermentalgiana TaxID=2315210 RepID=A0A2R5G3Z1_9STRA|nr:Dolichyl-diphosphooligosaccharide--protein glycosyltransferase subunit stt3 [Hondaea fermentalgiana]|eukprot:GBG25029.1 Dolichyl-diphosphooligosaccharide--protein glycosyltransferase subunit stt3 [Hondaea fermentalgiana]
MAKKKTSKAAEPAAATSTATAAAPGAAEDTAEELYELKGNHDNLVWWSIRIAVLACAIYVAYTIRLYAIKEYGLVIHEFDPWFNYRATEYLHEHGVRAFFRWYDHMSWYPLGRPVGTTIYPGMQLTSVAIWDALQAVGMPMSLNDVCCYVPAWFGVSASLFVGLLTAEATGNRNAGAFATLIMSCVPAHTMRSVGGGYDNESIAVTAMSMTFFFWCRSLRSNYSWPFGILSGLAYVYMVAAWGGYVFVVNMVGLHAIFLVFLGRFTTRLYWAYTLFYTIGTLGAIQIPVVGLTPLKSLEQLGPFGVWGIMQLLFICELIRKKQNLDPKQLFQLRIKVFSVAAVGFAIVCAMLYPTGYFGPLSSRVRGLFVTHTRTGNPLVDSVAEHQPASANAYYQYLHYTCYLAPIGFILSFWKLSDARIFLPLYGAVGYFFSAKMVRLIILLGPISSSLSGFAVAAIFEWCYDQFFASKVKKDEASADDASADASSTSSAKSSKKKAAAAASKEPSVLGPDIDRLISESKRVYAKNGNFRKYAAVFLIFFLGVRANDFYEYCHHMARAMSNPSIMYNARTRDGRTVLVDDYREAYFWLRDNTPADARVMAWWDYGYQIAGIANRTTIADGNTWNHEHIATLGRCLVSPEDKAHQMIRHLADYVLVWTGGGGDDLAKMPHIARIANSVYSEVCNGDPLCSQLGYKDRKGTPSTMMANSLIYKLHSGFQRQGVEVDPNRFENVFNSKYNKVRIWRVKSIDKESKAWSADLANKKCDPPPNDFICKGDYPPKFKDFLKGRRDFAQLEDFNSKKKSKEDEEYQKRYHEEMARRGQSRGHN